MGQTYLLREPQKLRPQREKEIERERKRKTEKKATSYF